MMRGYFGLGVEGISKPRNLGNLVRTAHSFGASFFFTIDPNINMKDVRFADTSDASGQMPLYIFDKLSDMPLPKHCKIVGVEFLEDAVDLPSFRHPQQAIYILGPERGNLSAETLAKCDYTIKIPMKFCVNVGTAGAIVLYDRLISMGRFAKRPVVAGGDILPLPKHTHGGHFHRIPSKEYKEQKK